MPWTTLKWDWNVHVAVDADLEYGVKSIHQRLWVAQASPLLSDFWHEKRVMMENYFAWMQEVEAEEDAVFDPEGLDAEVENGEAGQGRSRG